jgi:hypothetical protein
MKRLIALAIDFAPAWLWKSSNFRFVGSHTLHFCFGYEGRRTVEWDEREIAVGRRAWHD